MILDDRLDTVLRTEALGEEGSRTQYRQLIDLLGRLGGDQHLPERALERLAELDRCIPQATREAILRSSGRPLRHPQVVLRLASQSPPIAAAAVAAAQLDDGQWAGLIEALPLHARGFLRSRRDLGPRAQAILARLGIADMALPHPDEFAAEPQEDGAARGLPAPPQPPSLPGGRPGEIRGMVDRIEALLRRREATTAPVEPDAVLAGEARSSALRERDDAPSRLLEIDFASEPDGRIMWASQGCGPMLAGVRLGVSGPEAPARSNPDLALAFERRAPVRAGTLELDGAPRVAGRWQVDAVPRFDPASGGFLGYRGVLRRPDDPAGSIAQTDGMQPVGTLDARDEAGDEQDRLAQLLHELRTPVNAIQGFAELIQQQLFGPVPQPYRNHAARIAAEVANLLAEFDDLEKLKGRREPALGRGES